MTPNAIIISTATTILALVLAVFGSSWLNQRALDRLIEQLEKRFDARFDTLDRRIDAVEKRIDGIDSRLDRIERMLDSIFKPSLPSR